MQDKYKWYIVIIMLAAAEMLVAAMHGLPELSVIQWVFFALGVMRIGRLIAWDGVMHPLRTHFVKVVPHDSGAGDTTECRGNQELLPWEEAIGDLLCCPICVGTHAASLLLLVLSFWPELGQVAIWVFGGIGIAELANAVLEGFQWTGEAGRRFTGRGLE